MIPDNGKTRGRGFSLVSGGSRIKEKGRQMARMLMMVLWPSFLVAIVAEGVFFSIFEPAELALRASADEIQPLGVYTIGFFFFWGVCAMASLLTCYLNGPREPTPLQR